MSLAVTIRTEKTDSLELPLLAANDPNTAPRVIVKMDLGCTECGKPISVRFSQPIPTWSGPSERLDPQTHPECALKRGREIEEMRAADDRDDRANGCAAVILGVAVVGSLAIGYLAATLGKM